MSTADLLLLQGKCKTDPDGYKDEFLMRLRHYKSLLVRHCDVAAERLRQRRGTTFCICGGRAWSQVYRRMHVSAGAWSAPVTRAS